MATSACEKGFVADAFGSPFHSDAAIRFEVDFDFKVGEILIEIKSFYRSLTFWTSNNHQRHIWRSYPFITVTARQWIAGVCIQLST